MTRLKNRIARILRLPKTGAVFVAHSLRAAILQNGDYVLIVGIGIAVWGVWTLSEAFGRIVLGIFLAVGGFALLKGR